MSDLRILFVHGIGNHHADLSWQGRWEASARAGVRHWDSARAVETKFVDLDQIFAQYPVSWRDTWEALRRLSASGLRGIIGGQDLAQGAVSDSIRWTAGMVVQWVANDALRAQTRTELAAQIAAEKPDVICAHSLGSLVAYDTLTHASTGAIGAGLAFVSLGSQIGNALVVGGFSGGRLTMPGVRRWFHLYNPRDHMFTAPLALRAANFQQIETEFDDRGWTNHSAESYFAHRAALTGLWRSLATPRQPAFAAFAAAAGEPRTAKNRALLVGINVYARPEDRLQGCVNDTFLVSSVLQECGFDAGQIRLLADERATRAALLERLAWLLDDVQPGDQLVFYFSGHGVQLPRYNLLDEVDHVDECLAPADFAWSAENAVCDDDFVRLYNQLPYDAFVGVILDCGHAGVGLGGGPRGKALAPPDDIRHRLLCWDPKRAQWAARSLRPRIPGDGHAAWEADFVGDAGATRRLGRGASLRTLGAAEYDAVRAEREHAGPFLPVLLEACQDEELAFEHAEGAVPHGAFTFSLCKNLRRQARSKQGVTFSQLLAQTRRELRHLGYAQTPSLVGPRNWLEQRIPWHG